MVRMSPMAAFRFCCARSFKYTLTNSGDTGRARGEAEDRERDAALPAGKVPSRHPGKNRPGECEARDEHAEHGDNDEGYEDIRHEDPRGAWLSSTIWPFRIRRPRS